MAKDGRSFFERLTGTVSVDDFDEEQAREVKKQTSRDAIEERELEITHEDKGGDTGSFLEEAGEEGQLTVDVFNTPNEIVIKAIVAGVKPEDLDISITRDMVTVRGKREEHKEVAHEDYFYKELYWGAFSRTILLPQEIEVEQATASEKHGLLTIRLPKIDKERQTKLKVKSN